MSGFIDVLVQISCLASMIGASLVALSWAYPVSNRTKHGRILLLWLSCSDFFSSVVYFIQTFTLSAPGEGTYCRTMALVGIFFPVASFLWTDIIAYYLYCVVIYRKFYTDSEWKSLLRRFHIIAWSIPLLVVVIVSVYKHSGRSSTYSNTGGWCWVSGNSRLDILIWSIIGGKLIEWVSCFVILPYFYIKAALRLSYHEKLSRNGPESLEESQDRESIGSYLSSIHGSDLSGSLKDRFSVGSETDFNSFNSLSSNPIQESLLSSVVSNSEPPKQDPNSDISREEGNISAVDRPRTKSIVRFDKFYMKMGALPLIFFFIRFWGSVRVIMNYYGAPDSINTVFSVMQGIFDPSQGFFNALIFVFASKDGTRESLVSLSLFLEAWFPWCPGCVKIANWLKSYGSRSSVGAS